MSVSSIQCPKCHTQISVDEMLTHQLKEDLTKEYEAKRQEEREEERKKVLVWKEQREREFEEKIKKELLASSAKENKILTERLAQRDLELAKAQELELQLRKERNQLDDEKQRFELDKQRQLDAEREKIRQETAKMMLEEHRLKDAEKDKQLDGMKKTIEELQMRANLSSQQLQGEVAELEIEQILRTEFPTDAVLPVSKGISGADTIQKVHDQSGRFCGVIVWESKRTKSWSDGWVKKLKDDMLVVKGDIAVLVTASMPDGLKNFGFKDGIYITNFECLISVARILRLVIIKEQGVRSSVVGKNEKMEVLYSYLSGNEFRQRIEIIVEGFSSMQQDLDAEKRLFQKMWAKREKEIERVINNTVGMHGDLQGLMGTALPQIKGLELDNLEIEVISIEDQTSL